MSTKTINENSLLSDKEMHLLYGFSPIHNMTFSIWQIFFIKLTNIEGRGTNCSEYVVSAFLFNNSIYLF